MGRTWTGVALIGLGTYVSVDATTSVCGTNTLGAVIAGQSCGQAWTKFGFGLGMIGSGVLLATIFSDVPVVRNMTIAPTRGGVQVGASFGFYFSALVRPHRARAPFFAMADRFFPDSFSARALPPLRPPRRPSATAAGFFPSDCSMMAWTPLNAASFGSSMMLVRCGMRVEYHIGHG